MKSASTASLELLPLLSLPVPPMLAEALGYDGPGRFVAFWWEPAGDELCYSDGLRTVCGADWYAWLLYARHPRVEPCLFPYSFGSSEAAAQHVLLLDQWERNAYVGTHRAVMAFLDQNLLTFSGTDYVLAGIRLPTSSTPEDLWERQCRRRDSLLAWLDQRVSSDDA